MAGCNIWISSRLNSHSKSMHETRCNKNQHHGAWCYWCCIPFQRGLYLRRRLLNLKSPKLNARGVCCSLKICSSNQGTLVGDSRCKTPVESIHEHQDKLDLVSGCQNDISGQLGLIWLLYIYYMLLIIYYRAYPYKRCFQQIFVDFRIPPCSNIPAPVVVQGSRQHGHLHCQRAKARPATPCCIFEKIKPVS